MNRKTSVEDWASSDVNQFPMALGDHDEKSGKLPSKTFIRNAENNGHDMGYRIALTVEELGNCRRR